MRANGRSYLFRFKIASRILPKFLLSYTKNWKLFYKAEDIDLVSDRKMFDADVLAQEEAEHKAYMKTAPFVVKLQNFFC